ncbi:hypothetical protein HY224_02135, partial [Candidatus Uhrbacteria bacterium]|nr:hypothetical protein [Candidatus Uhrbacteria bacterium]
MKKQLLASLAKKILIKYKPQIIGVAGSAGKTSTKEAIYTVLRAKFKHQVARSLENYNSEIDLPLAVIGSPDAGDSFIRWFWILGKGLRLWLFGEAQDFPKVLVLEMGTAKPGDMAGLLKLVPCQIGVLTSLGSSHVEAFGSPENMAKEMGQIVTRLPKTGFAVLNADEKSVLAFKDKV